MYLFEDIPIVFYRTRTTSAVWLAWGNNDDQHIRHTAVNAADGVAAYKTICTAAHKSYGRRQICARAVRRGTAATNRKHHRHHQLQQQQQ